MKNVNFTILDMERVSIEIFFINKLFSITYKYNFKSLQWYLIPIPLTS